MPSIEKVNRLKQAKIAREAAVLVHVAAGINVNRAADAGDDQQHHQAQRVELQAEVHLQVADGQPVGDGFAGRRLPAVQR